MYHVLSVVSMLVILAVRADGCCFVIYSTLLLLLWLFASGANELSGQNRARVLQNQNQFQERAAGKWCKDRLPKKFSRSTRVTSGGTRAIRQEAVEPRQSHCKVSKLACDMSLPKLPYQSLGTDLSLKLLVRIKTLAQTSYRKNRNKLPAGSSGAVQLRRGDSSRF